MGTLRKRDLASRIAAKTGTSMTHGEQVLDAVLDSIQEALSNGDRVVLTGFGTFEVRQVKERKVRAIRGSQAGNLVSVPSHRRVGFSPGAEFKQAIRK